MRAKPPITHPAPKYGEPTSMFGPCEREDCESTARAECSVCKGHFCLSHAKHDAHRPSA